MGNGERAKRLAFQIEKRLEVLREWNAEGAPEEYPLPASLNKVREWNDLALGIEKIGSPSSFTTSHKVHGRSVSKISKLLVKLNAPIRKKRKSNTAKQLQKLRSENLGYKESLVITANQYASKRAELDKYQRLYRVARQSQEDAQHELAVADETIQELKAQLVRERANASRKKVTSIEFQNKSNIIKDK